MCRPRLLAAGDSSCQKVLQRFSWNIQGVKRWQNSKTQKNQIVTKLKNSKWEKPQHVTKLKNKNITKFQNSICDKTYKFKMWQNSKTQNVEKLQNLKCDKTEKNSNCIENSFTRIVREKSQKLKLLQNSTTQIVTRLRNSSWKQNFKKNLAKCFLVITTWHLDDEMFSRQPFVISRCLL